MKIFTIEDSRTGRSYDIPLERDISAYSPAQLRQIMAQQDASRQADIADTVSRASQAAAMPRGSVERADALQYQPLEIPSWTETIGKAFGSGLSQIAPTAIQSALGLQASTGGVGSAGYLADVIARARSGIPIRNPMAAMGERYAAARSPMVDEVAQAMKDFYSYDRTNVPEEQQFISDTLGGGAASALGYAATIPLGAAGLLPMAVGQTFDPSFRESVKRGATPGRAFSQAAIASGIEAGSEFALGVPGKIARRLGLSIEAIPVIKPIADSVDRIAKTWLGEMGVNIGQEGVEEMIAGLATDISAQYLTGTNPEAMQNFMAKRLEEFLGGAVGGAILGPAARQSRQIQERVERANKTIESAQSILRSRAELQQLRELRRQQVQGNPPVLPEQSEPITGIAEALARAGSDAGLQIPGFVEGMAGNVTSSAMAPRAPIQPRGGRMPGYVAGMGGGVVDDSMIPQAPSGNIVLPNGLVLRPDAMPPGSAPPGQDLPYNFLEQQARPQPIRLPNGLVLYPDDRPAGAADPGQELPYDFLASGAGGAVRLPSGITLYPDNRPTGSAPPEQDLPYDFLVQQAQAARTLAGKKKKAAKVVSISDEDAIAAEAEAQSRQRTTAAVSGPSIEDLEARSAEGGDQGEGQERRKEKLLKPGDSGPGVVAMNIDPPSETTPPPTQEELEVAASVLREPVIDFGLAEAATDKEYVKKFRDAVNKIKTVELPARREKILGDLLEEHRRQKPKFAQGNKSKALKDLEIWAAWQVSDPGATWSFLEMSVEQDLKERQQKFIQENLDSIGDVPGPDASQEDIQAYERSARLPWWGMAISTTFDGVPSPWWNPVAWLNKILTTSHRPGEKRQLTNVHALIQIGDTVYLMPVYDKGDSKLTPGRRVMIGDPDLIDKGADKFRATADSFALKYVDRAKFIGVIRLPVGAAQERMNKTKWTPEEAQDLIESLRFAQDGVIQSELYPGEDAGPVRSTTEQEGGVDVSFLSEVAAREPVMAHILDFVSAFHEGGDSPPIFGTDQDIKRWAIRRFEDFVRTNEDAYTMMHDIIGIMMRSAVVRSSKSGTQTVAGMPLGVAANPEYAKVWFKEQIAEAVLQEIRSNPTEISISLAGALGQAIPLRLGGKGGGDWTVPAGTSKGVATQLASRIAPAIQLAEQELRSRGLRTSQPGDYKQSVKKAIKAKKVSRARKLAKLRKGEAQQTQQASPVIEGRIEADIQALRNQAAGPRPQASTAIPRTAPPIQWKKFAGQSGAEYWMAPYDSKFDQWAKDNGVSRNAIVVQDFPGIGPVFRTNIDPNSFSEKIDKSKWFKVGNTGAQPDQPTKTKKPQPALTPEEQQLQSYVDAVSREVAAGDGKLNAPRVIQLAVKGMGGAKRKRFIEGTTSAEWFDEISKIEARHPELPPSQQEKIDTLLRFLSNVDNVGKTWTLERIQNFFTELSTGPRSAGSKKKSIRANAARFVADESEAKGFVEDFAKAFKKIGGDLLRVDTELDGPIAVEIQDDGKIVLAFNPEKLSKLSWAQWSVVWDEELRHTALFAYARSRIPKDFIGSIGARVREDLTEAWNSIDQVTRTRIEAELDAIYGDGLDDAQKTTELVRIIGQGHYVTEGITKKNLGQRFLDMVRDFTKWLKDIFGANPPKPIKDLVDGAEMLFKRTDDPEFREFDFGYQAAEDRNKAMVQAGSSDPSRESQRLTPAQVQKLHALQGMTPFGRKRSDEREAVQADMLDSASRDLLWDIELDISNVIPPGLSPYDRRLLQDERRSASIAYSRLKHLRELAGLENRLTSPSKGQQVMMGADPKLTRDESDQVLHDAIGVMDVDEVLRTDLSRLEDLLLRNLSDEADALRELNRTLGTTHSSPETYKEYIKNQLKSFRSDVATAFDLSRVTNQNAAAFSMGTNIPVAADRAALSAALSIVGTKGAVEDLKFLVERLANHSQLANLNAWPYDPDQFYDQLVSSGVLADAINGGPGLNQSQAIAKAVGAVNANVPPPLKIWGQLRDIIESLQGYKEEHRLALAELDRLAKIVDPLSAPSKGKQLSEKRALYNFQLEVKKRTRELDRLEKVDQRLRRAGVIRRSTERAVDVLSQVLNSADYIERAKIAYRYAHRRVSDVIYDVKPTEADRPGTIAIVMPPDGSGNPPEILRFELTFEQQSTDHERLRLSKTQQDIETWLIRNTNGDPALVETYTEAVRRIDQLLNPDYAISKETLNEAGLWRLIGSPFKLPVIREAMHPVLKEIEDEIKGPGKHFLSRAMAPFVKWGLFEQGLRPDTVKIRTAKRRGMESHGLTPRFRIFSKDIIDPWRMDREDDDYRWAITEPILRSLQNDSARHIKAGDTLDDYTGAISSNGKITVTKEDIEAAKAQYEYEKKIRDFTSRENFGFGEGQIDEIQIVEDSVAGQKRTRLPFAAGPGVMSRSLSVKANGDAMDHFRRVRIQIPQTAGADRANKLDKSGMEQLRLQYLSQVLNGSTSGGITDIATWGDVIMSHIKETNPEYAMRRNSKLAAVYDSIAIDLLQDSNFRINNWTELISTIASRMQSVLNDQRSGNERAADAEKILSNELTNGMENIRTIVDNQERAAVSNVEIVSPKSSFTTARGHLVGPPGLYEHGLHSDFSINALHGTVLRHVTDNLLKGMEVTNEMLKRYIDRHKGSAKAGTISERKAQGLVAYRLNEAIRLQKAIANQITVMKQFEEATHDPEQYFHDIMRWSGVVFVRVPVSVLWNVPSSIRDTALTLTVNTTRQRRSLWYSVNWLFTSAKSVEFWIRGVSNMVLNRFAESSFNKGLLRKAADKIIPGFAQALHDAQQQVAEWRAAGDIKGLSFVDNAALMDTSGSLLGVMGSQEYEQTRPFISSAIKYIDRFASRVPLLKTAMHLTSESRTIVEDANAVVFRYWSDFDKKRVVEAAMKALQTRDQLGSLVMDPLAPGFPLTQSELGMTFGGLNQAHRWFGGGPGFDKGMLEHYLKHKNSPSGTPNDIRYIISQPLPKGMDASWDSNYITEVQIQSLRERPPVAFRKGLYGRIARTFSTYRTWSSNAFYSIVRGEILRGKVGKKWYIGRPEEVANLIVMLVMLMVVGAPSVLAIDWMRDKLWKPMGVTVENMIRNPDLHTAALLTAGVAAQVIPNGNLIDSSLSGIGSGSFDIAKASVVLGGYADVYRTLATIASTAVWNDPGSWKDALSFGMSNLLMRRVPVIGAIAGNNSDGYRKYIDASRAVKALAPSDVDRSGVTIGKIPSSPAYDNVRRAMELFESGKIEEAQEEANEGLRQIIADGVDPDEAREKLQAAFGAQSAFRTGFERALTEAEKVKIMERATPRQRESILDRENAVKQLSAMFSKGRSSFAGGAGRPIQIRSARKLAARRSQSQRLAAMTPSKQFLRPIQVRSRRRRVRSRDRLARLARLRKQVGLAP